MLAIGFAIGVATGAGMVLFGVVLAYRIAQIHQSEADSD